SVCFPAGGLLLHGALEIPRHDQGDDNERELHLEHAVGQILPRLRQPQRDTADDLARGGKPDEWDELVHRGVWNRPEQSKQTQADDKRETYDRRRPEGVDRQRERPAPRFIDPFRIRGMFQPIEHVHFLDRYVFGAEPPSGAFWSTILLR